MNIRKIKNIILKPRKICFIITQLLAIVNKFLNVFKLDFQPNKRAQPY